MDKPTKQQEQLIARGEPSFKRIILDARQRSTNQLCSHARVPEDANKTQYRIGPFQKSKTFPLKNV